MPAPDASPRFFAQDNAVGASFGDGSFATLCIVNPELPDPAGLATRIADALGMFGVVTGFLAGLAERDARIEAAAVEAKLAEAAAKAQTEVREAERPANVVDFNAGSAA